MKRISEYENASANEIDWCKKVFLATLPTDDQTPETYLIESLQETYFDPAGSGLYRLYRDNNGNSEEMNYSQEKVVSGWNSELPGLVIW